jgi:hypothetical protein
MNALKTVLTLAACVAAFAFVAPNKAAAQPSPEEFRQRMMDGLRERLAITNDAEWDAISPKIAKVMDAQRDVMSMRIGGMRGMFGGGRQRRNADDNGGGNADNNGGGRRRGGGMFGGEPAASVTALQTALENKAPKEEIKTKLAAVRAESKQKEATLQAAREDLRGVLTSRQEATLVVAGLLD